MAVAVQSEEVVFEVCDNYQKQTYRNRAYIAHNNGRLLLNVPVKHSKSSDRQKTADVECENSFPWQSQHWKSLQVAYRTSPFFEYYEDELEPLFTEPVVKLMNHNLKIYQVLCEILGTTSDYSVTDTYQMELKSGDYRSMVVAKNEPNYQLEPYTQVLESLHGYLSNLSVLDLLFNEGPNATDYLQRQKILLES